MGVGMRQPDQKHVLVVEDNEDVRKVVTIYLRSNGFKVSEAADGVLGLEAAHREEPDIILFDVLLPRLDGIEALRKMRREPWGQRIPVIMMSAVLQTKDVKRETASLDVSSFLQKPFQVRTLVEEINKALSPRNAGAEGELAREPEVAVPGPGEGKDGRSRLSNQPREIPEYGTLEDFPLPHVIHGVFVSAKTGRMRIVVGTTEKRIYFQNGFPVFAESSIPEETLGAHLVAKGRITEEQHAEVRAQMNETGRRFGEVMLKKGLLGPHELYGELENHLAQKVMSTFAWKIGKFKFEQDDTWKDDVIIVKMKPGRIVLDGIHKHWNIEEIRQTLGMGQDFVVTCLEDSPYFEEQLELTPREARILQIARRGAHFSKFGKSRQDLDFALSTLFGLFIMQEVGFLSPDSGKKMTSTTGPKRKSVSPRPVVARNEEVASELMAEYLKYRTADYFELLGLTREASNDEISAAFRDRQKRYHPDTLIGIDAGLVHEKIEELFIRVHTAYKTLIDPASRRRYERELDGGAKRTLLTSRSRTGKFSTLENKSEDQILFEDAFSLLRNGDFERALPLFMQAENLEKKPRYSAYRVWTEYLVDPISKARSAERELADLLKGGGDEPLFAYLLGNFYLREKENKKAIAYFEKALNNDPQHIDSARQLRILRMRQKSETSGLFDLFKKR